MMLSLALATVTTLTAFVGTTAPFQDPVEAGGRRPTPNSGVEVAVKGSTLVRGTKVLIGDLVTIEPAGPLATHIAALEFGNPPTFGFVRRATVAEIRNRLAAQGVDLGQLTFSGSHNISIQSTFREVHVSELRDVAEAVLHSVLEREPGEEIEIELEQAQASIRVPPGRRDLEYQARVRPNSITQNGAIVDVTFLVDGIPDKTLPIRYRLDRFQYVLKTTRSIRAGEPLDSGNMVRTRELVSATRGFYASQPDQLAGLVARRDLAKGTMVSINDGQEPAMIRAGDLIEIVASRGSVEITMRAKALTSGARGEAISVQNLSNERAFKATVFAPGLAVVGPTR